MPPKSCPIRGMPCNTVNCAWWVISRQGFTVDGCALKVLAQWGGL